jgi:hypothetical protein
MDISIAVIHLKNSSTFNLKNICSPDKFDILLINGNQNGKIIKNLPKRRIKSPEDISGEAIKIVKELYGTSIACHRAVPIPIHLDPTAYDIPTTSSSISTASTSSLSYSTLFCIPMLDNDLKRLKLPKGFEYENLSNLLNDALNMSWKMETETRHFIERIDNWLSTQQQKSVDFLSRLFSLKPLKLRLRVCVHNPAANPEYLTTCLTTALLSTNSSNLLEKKVCIDLEEAVKKSNAIRISMIGMDKYDKYLMNPVFNAGRQKSKITDYFAKGKNFTRYLKIEDQKSPTELWETQFPIHKAAYDDDFARIQTLLEKGYDPNAYDNDLWTPLHYCAFYGKLQSAGVLMSHAITDVNAKNKKGETPLHFAALNGYYHLIELILSNPKIDVDILNDRNQTAFDICKDKPRNEWEQCAWLLKNNKPKKMEVYYGEKGSLYMSCGHNTTAEQLRDIALIELGLSQDCAKLFAIWIITPRLQLQLNPKQTVLRQLDKYNDYLELWGDPIIPRPGIQPEISKPTVCFRRHAQAMVKHEEDIAKKCPKVIEYLFSEVMAHYLQGLCPCDDKDYIYFSSILAILRFGSEPINETMLNQIMPSNAIPQSKSKKQSLIKSIESRIKQFQAKDPFTLQLYFMNWAWKMRCYGCTYFKAIMHMSKPNYGSVHVTIGINDYGLCIINMLNYHMMDIIKHRELDPFPEAKQNSIDFNIRKGGYVFSFTTPQVKLIDTLLRNLQKRVHR